MLTAFAEFWAWTPPAEKAATGPGPKSRPAPVFIGDILMSRGGEPELLHRWREEQRDPPAD